MADKVQQAVTAWMRSNGFHTIKSVDAIQWGKLKSSGVKLPDEPGRADMVVMRDGRAVFVEVKNASIKRVNGHVEGGMSFPFSDWRDNQREWAEMMLRDFGMSTYICLVMGQGLPHLKIETEQDLWEKRPRKAWLIRSDFFLQTERIVNHYGQSTLPYFAGKGFDLAMQEDRIDAIQLLKREELIWRAGLFSIPVGHIFWSHFREEVRP